MKSLKLFTIISFLALSLDSFSQIGITSYSIYAIGFNTSVNRRIGGEIKTFANRNVDDINLEVNGFYNFHPRQYHRFSVGLGVNFAPFNEFDRIYAFTIPALIEVYPLQDFKKVSIIFELTPEILPEDGVNLRTLWGIRYTFGNK